ncbi:MAG TPA: iron uptake transporter deferrochelatase/peroxidase subunit [Streptosporangiaceae bacterium]|jgi:deferrochelatase/peroxidase EfeB|nr:iron uptake transporter deferrochelatase/peroxidase subunit [Streptosporangiaceae bacterium]
MREAAGPPERAGAAGPPSPRAARGGVSRRGLLGGTGAVGAGLLAGAVGGCATGSAGDARTAAAGTAASAAPVPFYGPHQAGIITPAQDRLAFGALDLAGGVTRSDLRDLLREWTRAAELMTRGRPAGPSADPSAPPADTGEATGLPTGRLTITIGYGPSLFGGRLGLSSRKPAALRPLPVLANEDLDPDRSGGDLCLQACSDDPQVAFHAVRNLARIGQGTVVHKWLELGFGRTSSTSSAEATPRNLLGFKDGTRNVKAEQGSLLDRWVWIGPEAGQPWLRGGSYLVTRRIRMFIENWDRDFLQDQENVIGRSKASGAPLSGGTEFTAPDFTAASGGQPVIPADSHIRLASHEHNGGTRILRRGYSFTDGIVPETGTLDGGLFFIAYMRDPAQFVRLQQSLTGDALNEYIRHVSSAVFVCPPGLRPGQDWGSALFG